MNTDIKQAMHVGAGKSFGTAEAMKMKDVGTMTRLTERIRIRQPLRQDQNEIEFRDRS